MDEISNEKYINLETYKKDGTPIRTPVWFVTENNKMYVITRESTGKVKRLKNNPKTRFAVCGFKGEIKGEWIDATAKTVQGDEAERAVKLRKSKYGFKALLAGFMTKAKGDLVVYLITPASK